jgi:hypothetical protein
MTTTHRETETITTTAPARRRRDARSFWRIALAVIAPLPMLGMGLSYAIAPFGGDDPFAATVDAMRAHHGQALTSILLGLPFLLFLIPATTALAWISRRRTPVLTTVGALLAVPGFLLGFALLPPDENLQWAVANNSGLDVTAAARLDDALWAQPITGVAIIGFLAAVTIGLPILGIAMWRSKAAPVWMAVCLIAGTSTHIFIPGHVAKGVGLLVAAVGFLGVSRALLRSSNDDFDLPPRS